MSQSHYNNSSSGDGGSGNMWSGGSRGGSFGSRGGFSRSNDDDDDHQGSSGERSYRGSYGNKYSSGGGSGGGGSGGGSYGFRRDGNQSRGDMEIQRDTIFIQDLPREITREQINDAFSTVGPIKVDDRSGGPKIWIYKDRNTDEPNGRATVTYEDDDTANRAIQKYHDQHIDSIGAAVRVQLAQRRPRNNDRGGFGGGNRGYRGGRSTWDSNNSRQGFGSDGNRWESFGRGGGGGGFRGRSGGEGGDSFQDSGDRDRSYRSGGSSSGQYRGASRGRGGSSNYAPY